MSIQAIGKDSKPIYLTTVLFIIAIIFIYLSKISNEINLWIDVTFFTILNIGFIVALIFGVKTKNKATVLFSVLVNSAFIMMGTFFIIIYLSVILVT